MWSMHCHSCLQLCSCILCSLSLSIPSLHPVILCTYFYGGHVASYLVACMCELLNLFSPTKSQLAVIYYTALMRPNKAETALIAVCSCILWFISSLSLSLTFSLSLYLSLFLPSLHLVILCTYFYGGRGHVARFLVACMCELLNLFSPTESQLAVIYYTALMRPNSSNCCLQLYIVLSLSSPSIQCTYFYGGGHVALMRPNKAETALIAVCSCMCSLSLPSLH